LLKIKNFNSNLRRVAFVEVNTQSVVLIKDVTEVYADEISVTVYVNRKGVCMSYKFPISDIISLTIKEESFYWCDNENSEKGGQA